MALMLSGKLCLNILLRKFTRYSCAGEGNPVLDILCNGFAKSFPLAAKAVRFAPVLHMPKAPGGKEGRCGCLHVQRVVIHKWTPELGRFPAFE